MNSIRRALPITFVAACVSIGLTPSLQAQLLTIRNDGLNFSSTVVANQAGYTLVYDGGRNGVLPGEAVFIEGRSPDWLGSLNALYTLNGNDVRIGWQFASASGIPNFPLSLQQATLGIGDIDWRDAAGNIVERGAAQIQILSGNWRVSSVEGTGVAFQFNGPSSISSLQDLAFSARLYNSVTIPEPSTIVLGALGIAIVVVQGWRKQRAKSG